MKKINYYIQEKLRINSKTSISKEYKPRTFIELKNLIYQEYKEQDHPDILDLNHIDISDPNIDNLINIFEFSNIKINNVDVSKWDVSNIRNFKETFACMKNFDCDLSDWNVSNGEYFDAMFIDCKKFDGKFLENWNMSKAKDIQFMIARCDSITDKVDFTNWFEQLSSIPLKKQLYECLKSCPKVASNSDILHGYRDKYLS